MKMIPPTYHDETERSEVKVFELLSNCEVEGTCYHNLRFPVDSPVHPSSEIDFLILTRRALVALEVKGGKVVSRNHQGHWFFGKRGPVPRSPFDQASQNCFDLRARLLENGNLELESTVKRTAINFALSFPLTDFNRSLIDFEVEPWQIHDASAMTKETFDDWLNYLLDQTKEKFGKGDLDDRQISTLEKKFRPEFQFVPSLGSTSSEFSSELFEMTEDQINSIQTGEVAERILYTGGAGTGKTILAVEIARQHVSNGLDTTILCGSTFVAEYLKRQPQVSGIRFLPFSQRNSKQEKTDVLIVDEAQNILDLEGLAIIDDWVEGGIAEGRWRVFLDDNAQSKFSKRYDPDCHDELKSFAVINPPLVKNCRNTKEVVEWVGKFTGADIGVPTITTGKGVVIKFFDSGESEADYLGDQLAKLLDQVPPKEIVIISSLQLQNSCVNDLPHRVKDKIKRLEVSDMDKSKRDRVLFASPSEFQGLESEYVFVVDLADPTAITDKSSELYVAMTRAQSGLWLLLDSELENIIVRAYGDR